MTKYINSLTKYERLTTHPVRIGNIIIGGKNPIAVQSMTNTDTMDTAGCVAQIGRIHSAGCDIVRLTVPALRDAENLPNTMQKMREEGIKGVAIVADIHFTPDVAMAAAMYVDKVRINPGNYNDPDGTKFAALLQRCRERGVALRIGVNHGSLAPHIVEKWGDTPRGMVESAMEYLEACRSAYFDQVVVSIKASNVRVMVYAYRMLVAQMNSRGMSYPLHLGVTEAGSDADGRIKSAVGIGALLVDGIGDTIRVSLTEPPEDEIPVAKSIIRHFEQLQNHEYIEPVKESSLYSPYEYRRTESVREGNVGGTSVPPLYNELDADAISAVGSGRIAVLTSTNTNPAADWRATILNMGSVGDRRPVILHRRYNETSLEELQIKAAADFGVLFIDGLADGIWIENNIQFPQQDIDDLSLSILQAARVRMSKTEFIACPGCGRTQFDLQSTLAVIKNRTSHLKGLKIGVMGCIVNGPGEMADADYGYVGQGSGRVTLYKNREVIRRSIPQAQAIDALIELIKEGGDWHNPQ